jgi:hypothetical protein
MGLRPLFDLDAVLPNPTNIDGFQQATRGVTKNNCCIPEEISTLMITAVCHRIFAIPIHVLDRESLNRDIG